jgi:hypothetical protein
MTRTERLQAREVTFSLNLYAIIIDRNQERVEWGEEKRGDLLLSIHTPWQEAGHRKKRHTREHECPNFL